MWLTSETEGRVDLFERPPCFLEQYSGHLLFVNLAEAWENVTKGQRGDVEENAVEKSPVCNYRLNSYHSTARRARALPISPPPPSFCRLHDPCYFRTVQQLPRNRKRSFTTTIFVPLSRDSICQHFIHRKPINRLSLR